MLCRFRGCIKKATCSVNYYYYGDAPILCEHHKELLTILCGYYHRSTKEEELKLRRICLYLYNTDYADYGHCSRAEVKICIYCHSIDYIDFPINEINAEGICKSCIEKKSALEEIHKNELHGWDAAGYIAYKNKKWTYVKF